MQLKAHDLLQVVLMGLAESYRNNGSAPGVDGLDKLYPVSCPNCMPGLRHIVLCYLFLRPSCKLPGQARWHAALVKFWQCNVGRHPTAVDSAKQLWQNGMLCEAAADLRVASNSM